MWGNFFPAGGARPFMGRQVPFGPGAAVPLSGARPVRIPFAGTNLLGQGEPQAPAEEAHAAVGRTELALRTARMHLERIAARLEDLADLVGTERANEAAAQAEASFHAARAAHHDALVRAGEEP
jgi:hypothetical protein